MGRLLPFTMALGLLGCGSSSNLSADAGSLAECRVVDRFTFLEDDGIVVALAAQDDLVGVLWRHTDHAWKLSFGAFPIDDPHVRDPVELGIIPSTTRVGLQPFGEGFASAWVDFEGCTLSRGCPDDADRPGRVHVTTVAGGAIAGDVVLPESLPGHVALGSLGSGLAALWEEDDFQADHARIWYATSRDGETFDDPRLLHEGIVPSRGQAVGGSPTDMAVAWWEGAAGDERLMLALIRSDGSASEPVRVEGHSGWIRDVRVAFGHEGYGIATIETNEQDTVHFSVVDETGASGVRELSMTPGFLPWQVDVAWGGGGFAIVADGHLDPEGDDDPTLFLQHADSSGMARFGALDVAEGPASNSHVAGLGNERYVVSWGEGLRGALVDCSPP